MAEPLFFDADIAELSGLTWSQVHAVELSFQTQYIVIVSLTILLYDYCLNLSYEVNWIWLTPKKCSLTIILYTLNRYISILAIPAVMMQYFWENMDPDRLKTCLQLTRFHYYIIFGSQAMVAAVLILRAYALYEKSRWVLAGLCIITLLAAILGILSIAKAPPTSYTRYDLLVKGTCILPSSLDIVGRYMPSIITAMLLEVAVFVLTLCKSIQHMRSGSRLLDLLLRDGIFYFGAVMLAHFGVILSYYLPEDISRGNFATLANCLNSTLISRLILHLRDPSLLPNHSDDQDTQGILSTVVLTGGPDGKIGAPHEVSFGLNSDIESSEFKPDRYTDERELDPKPLSNTTSHV